MNADNDPRFELLPQVLKIVVPNDYDHSTQLAKFCKQYWSTCDYFSDDINDSNGVNVTVALLPGHKYGVKLFLIKKEVSFEDCISFLTLQKALFVGMQGMSVVFVERYELMKRTAYISIDKEENLPTVNGIPKMPSFYAYADGRYNITLNHFMGPSYMDNVLLCFYDEN